MRAVPNPTHQLHLVIHWLWMYATRTLGLGAREVELWADCDPETGETCMGPYGQGLAEALFSKPRWLPQYQEPVVFDKIKFDVRVSRGSVSLPGLLASGAKA